MMWLYLQRDISDTDLVGNVVDSDVMHGCTVTLKQSMEVSPTVSGKRKQIYFVTILPGIQFQTNAFNKVFLNCQHIPLLYQIVYISAFFNFII